MKGGLGEREARQTKKRSGKLRHTRKAGAFRRKDGAFENKKRERSNKKEEGAFEK